jgi:hypothetical protein
MVAARAVFSGIVGAVDGMIIAILAVVPALVRGRLDDRNALVLRCHVADRGRHR